MAIVRERRRSMRSPCVADAHVWQEGDDEAARAVAVDVSEHGARLMLLDAVEIRGRVRVWFPGPRTSSLNPVPADVARSVECPGNGGHAGATVGVSFAKRQNRLADRLSIGSE